MLYIISPVLLVTTIMLLNINMVPVDNLLKTINLKIQKEQPSGIWRVHDNEGNNRGTLIAKKADKIFWQPQGSEMVFMFSKNVGKYFTFEDGKFSDGHSQSVANNDMLKLTVREDAPSDTLIYRVYVVSADTFVVGNSPPKIIIN